MLRTCKCRLGGNATAWGFLGPASRQTVRRDLGTNSLRHSAFHVEPLPLPVLYHLTLCNSQHNDPDNPVSGPCSTLAPPPRHVLPPGCSLPHPAAEFIQLKIWRDVNLPSGYFRLQRRPSPREGHICSRPHTSLHKPAFYSESRGSLAPVFATYRSPSDPHLPR